MSYINETDFVIENKKLVYPEIVSDGLQLYYDAKGKRDTDYHRDTMLDMSGNKNHGKLYNFAYEKHSGYKDGLVFDYIDDKLVRPTLNLKPDDFTFMLNGNIISFSPDGTVKRVQDGEVIERKGVNFLSNTNNKGQDLTYKPTKQYHQIKSWSFTPNQGEKFYVRVLVYTVDRYTQIYFSDSTVYTHTKTTENYEGWQVIEAIFNANTSNRVSLGIRTSATSNWNEITLRNIQAINLTATFGAGNEPTIEEIQAEPDKWQWLPNPLDLLESEEYEGNYLGDMENIIDGLYKTEVLSGEEIYTDKADDAVVHVEVDGKSVGGGSGKNLFYPINLSTSKTYITGLKPNTKYTMSTNTPIPGVHNLYFSTLSMGVDDKSRGGEYTATTDENGSIWYQIYPGRPYTQDLIDGKYWIQLEEGSTATAYEPPAPTPDYPIEIHSLIDFDVVSSVGGRNLILNSQLVSNSPNNTGLGRVSLMKDESTPYYRVIGDKIISTYGFDGSATSSRFSEPMINNDTYTVSVDVRAPRTGRVSFFDGIGSQSILKANEWIRIKHTYTYKGMSYRVIGLTYNSSIIDYRNWKIEKGSTATDWTPAPEDNLESDNHPLIDKINLLLDEPLRSVGDIKDRLFRDSDGLWKIERNVGEIKEWADKWVFMETKNGFRRYLYGDNSDIYKEKDINNKIANIKSSHFRTVIQIEDITNTFSGHNGNGLQIRISEQLLPTDSTLELKNYLNNKGVIVQYQKATSSIETLPQPLQDKLNNLRSFEDSNYVYTVLTNENNNISNNLKPTLHAKFLYNNWYKEDRVINNLMIYNRALTNEEMLQNYKTIKRRWGM